MTKMIELLKNIYPLALAPVSPDTDKAVEIMKKYLPFKVYEFNSGEEHNGWTIPMSWKVIKADIRKDGKLIFDGTKHPLGVMGYAKSFSGKMSLAKLKKHLTYRKDLPNAIGYYCDYYYKQWLSDWGFSVPYSLYKEMEEGKYKVELETRFEKGTMKVIEYHLPGKTKDTILFNAHNCHAGQANDDIAGVVVGMELMRRLSKRKNWYSYRLVIAPEHLGTVFYLKKLGVKSAKQIKYGFFLEMLGNSNRLILQKSFHGDTYLDKVCIHYLSTKYSDFQCADFRKVIGNDETVWESPGYEIPTVSLSRWPYPEYHTSMDNEVIIAEEKLEDAVNTLLGIVNIFETNCKIKRKFDGLIALSNPKYDLYIKPGTDPSISEILPKDATKWNYLMDCIPRYFNGEYTVFDIALRHNMPYEELYDYIKKFKDKGLVNLEK